MLPIWSPLFYWIGYDLQFANLAEDKEPAQRLKKIHYTSAMLQPTTNMIYD